MIGIAFREDEARTDERNLRENLAWLDRFELSLLNQHSSRQSV